MSEWTKKKQIEGLFLICEWANRRWRRKSGSIQSHFINTFHFTKRNEVLNEIDDWIGEGMAQQTQNKLSISSQQKRRNGVCLFLRSSWWPPLLFDLISWRWMKSKQKKNERLLNKWNKCGVAQQLSSSIKRRNWFIPIKILLIFISQFAWFDSGKRRAVD